MRISRLSRKRSQQLQYSLQKPQAQPLALCLMLFGLSTSSGLEAGLLANATRVIYDAHDREKSLIVANTNTYPVINQVWVDDGSNQIEFADPPFVVLPAVFKMSAGEMKALRIVYNDLALAQDRESVYWINLYEIPSVASDLSASNQLHMAMNTRIKIFYRPTALTPMSISAMAASLEFQCRSEPSLNTAQSAPQVQHPTLIIRVRNPTPYHVTFLSLSIASSLPTQLDQMQYRKLYSANQMQNMIAPFSHTEFMLQQADLNLQSMPKLRFSLIDDDGKSQDFERACQSVS